MPKLINIFYAHSSHRQTVKNLFEKVYEYFENDENIHIIDVDNEFPKNNSLFLGNLIDNLEIADFMICDITPDFIPFEHTDKDEIEITPCINANVMYELGYFQSHYNFKNVALILDESVSKSVPSMLRGHFINRYESAYESETVDMIIYRIKQLANILP
jgi:predicted nucleotide-binding protein